jgi:hypothetical protein
MESTAAAEQNIVATVLWAVCSKIPVDSSDAEESISMEATAAKTDHDKINEIGRTIVRTRGLVAWASCP